MATPEQLRRYYQGESLDKYSSTSRSRPALPRLYINPAAKAAAEARAATSAAAAQATVTRSPTATPSRATPEQLRQYYQSESLGKYSSNSPSRPLLPDLGKIPNTSYKTGGRGMAPGSAPATATANASVNAAKAAPGVAVAAANPVANAAKAAPAIARSAAGALVNSLAGPVAGGVGAVVGTAVGLVLLDPFNKTANGEIPKQKDLMPPDEPKVLEPTKIPFVGGQSPVFYEVFVYSAERGTEINTGDQGTSLMKTIGPISEFYLELVEQLTIPVVTFRYWIILKGSDGLRYRYILGTPNGYVAGFQAFKNPRLVRSDRLPDTGGNPPPTQQTTYTTNITNVYNAPPEIGDRSSPSPSLNIMPSGAAASSSVAPAPPPEPQLQPKIPLLVSPLPFAEPQETNPPIAQSPPPPNYPQVTVTPSTGITPEAAAASSNSGLQVTPSTGVPPAAPAVAPIPTNSQQPVNNPQGVPSFPGQPQQTLDRESIAQQLLEIEQLLIQHRIAISAFTPTTTSQSISEQIQQQERRITRLRNNISTATRQTLSPELQQTEQALENQTRGLTNLEPSASAEIERNRLEQTRQRIIRLRNSLNNQNQNQTQPQTQPQTQEQTQTTDLLERMREQLTNTGIAIASLTPLINPIQQTARNTTPEALRNAAKQGTCDTFQPGGCATDIRLNSQNAANGIQELLNRLTAANQALIPLIWANTQTINNKLGAQIPGGISGFLQTAFRATRLDKIINALTLITVLHNAAMLSRNLGQTLGELTSQALATIGIKDENDSPLDINEEIGRQVNSLMSTILGAETWAGTKLAWNKANAIISSANQIIWTVRSIADSGKEVTEWIANNTGKIGNALKRFRVVGENAYPHMAENVSHQNAWMLKVQRYREGVDSLDDAASSLQGVLGEVQNIQQEAQELKEQKQRFDRAIQDAQPKVIPDNNPIKEKAAEAKTASQSPANQADAFRGEGEITNA